MIIKVDKEAQEIIQRMCDIALRAGGLANMQSVADVLAKMELLPEQEIKDKAKA